jgi:acetyl esterase/lipase
MAKTALLDNVTLVPEAIAAATCLHNLNATYDIPYISDENPKHTFDLFRAAGAPAPVVVWIHGGGWQSGSKENIMQVKYLVCAGYSVAAINYRLSAEAVFPAQIHDVKASIRYIRANAANLGVNATNIVTFGSSAGGHLAALAATSVGVNAFENLTMGNVGTSSDVQAAVVWYGPVEFESMDEQLLAQGCPSSTATHNRATSPESKVLGCSGTGGLTDPECDARLVSANPITYISSSTPPMYILHGENDCVVPAEQTSLLYSALDKAGICSIRRVVQGADHGNKGTQMYWTSAPVQSATVEFLERYAK